MKLRSIKSPAGRSKVSLAEATRAAKVVRRESSTGRFIVVPPETASGRDAKSAKHLAKKR